jgi:hypothetical protein
VLEDAESCKRRVFARTLHVLSDHAQPIFDVLHAELVVSGRISPTRVAVQGDGLVRVSAFEGDLGQAGKRVGDPALPLRRFKDAPSLQQRCFGAVEIALRALGIRSSPQRGGGAPAIAGTLEDRHRVGELSLRSRVVAGCRVYQPQAGEHDAHPASLTSPAPQLVRLLQHRSSCLELSFGELEIRAPDECRASASLVTDLLEAHIALVDQRPGHAQGHRARAMPAQLASARARSPFPGTGP